MDEVVIGMNVGLKTEHSFLAFILTSILINSLACSRPIGATSSHPPPPLFTSENPQSIYVADPNDSWNRIFRALFTRTIKARIASDLKQGTPFVSFRARMGWLDLRISRDPITRTEIGDRAIEPLYPGFLTIDGPLQVLNEPGFSNLAAALRDAIAANKLRSPVERALMQADVWAAYDVLYSIGPGIRRKDPVFEDRKTKLLELLQSFIWKLALTPDEIKSLDNNYVRAIAPAQLPNIFAPESGWLEIELLSHRSHDEASDYRRAARVFVKPRSKPVDPAAFVESLKHNQHLEEVEAVALVVQNLLIDTSGKVQPSPLFSDVQFRIFRNNPAGSSPSAEPRQFELSRKKLLTDPASGGLIEFEPTAPAYLSAAGNDYNFATRIEEAGAPVLVPLRTRCSQCHFEGLATIMTYSIHDIPPVPTARVLNSSERAVYVAQRKEQREDFKSLLNRTRL